MTNIHVDSEFSPLRRVVVAQSEVMVPQQTGDHPLDTSFLHPDEAAQLIGKDFAEAQCRSATQPG